MCNLNTEYKFEKNFLITALIIASVFTISGNGLQLKDGKILLYQTAYKQIPRTLLGAQY